MIESLKNFLQERKALILPVILLLVLGISTCCTGLLTQPGTFAVEPNRVTIDAVVDRYNSYLPTAELTDADRLVARDDVEKLVTGLTAQPTIAKTWFRFTFEPVAARHDMWVTHDVELLDYQRSTALRSTEILREFYPND